MKNNEKWWGRLANIIIWFLVAGSFVFSVFIIFNNKTTKSIYSFETSYSSYIDKKESIVDPVISTSFNDSQIPSFEEFSARLDKNSLIEKYMDSYPKDITYDYRSWGNTIMKLRKQGLRDDLIFDKLMKTELGSSLKVKVWSGVDAIYFLWLLLPVLVYFGLTLFYKKVILYVIFGNKELNN